MWGCPQIVGSWLSSFGCGLGFVGVCSFEVDGGLVSDAGVASVSVVEHLDPRGDFAQCLFPRAPSVTLVILVFQGRLKRLGHGIVETHSSTSHRLVDTEVLAYLVELITGELSSPIRVEHQALRHRCPQAML